MKKSFVTGLIIIMPIILTILLFVFLVDLFTTPFLDSIEPFLASKIHLDPTIISFIARIIILFFLFVFILFLGFIARWFFIRPLIKWGNAIIERIPIIKFIYRVTKDIISAFFSPEGRKAFNRPVMLPFPFKDSFSVGFYSGSIPKECIEKSKADLSPVFIPTAPHPISGYLIMVAKEKVKEIKMTNEEAIKFTVSCGVVVPEEKNES